MQPPWALKPVVCQKGIMPGVISNNWQFKTTPKTMGFHAGNAIQAFLSVIPDQSRVSYQTSIALYRLRVIQAFKGNRSAT